MEDSVHLYPAVSIRVRKCVMGHVELSQWPVHSGKTLLARPAIHGQLYVGQDDRLWSSRAPGVRRRSTNPFDLRRRARYQICMWDMCGQPTGCMNRRVCRTCRHRPPHPGRLAVERNLAIQSGRPFSVAGGFGNNNSGSLIGGDRADYNGQPLAVKEGEKNDWISRYFNTGASVVTHWVLTATPDETS